VTVSEDDDQLGGLDGSAGREGRGEPDDLPASVVPAPGSGAVLSPAGAGPTAPAVTWTFPIEVEVVGQLSDEHLRAVARHVFDELDVALRAVGRA
jgi:hypothetical protein